MSAIMFTLNLHYSHVARLDVSAESFWRQDKKMAFFMPKYLINPLAASYASFPLLNWAELEKKKMWVCEVEREIFSPVVFSWPGGIGPAAIVVYKRFATLISEKRGHCYSQTLWTVLLTTLICSDVHKGIQIKPLQVQFMRFRSNYCSSSQELE